MKVQVFIFIKLKKTEIKKSLVLIVITRSFLKEKQISFVFIVFTRSILKGNMF